MSWRHGSVVAGVLLAALAATGCGLGPGADVGQVETKATRDFGATEVLAPVTEDAKESDTAMRVLERTTEIGTRYGGAYVKSIDGLEETERGSAPYDWFYFVDGVEASIGAGDSPVGPGERIWWDYRNWSATDYVPAVVGQWPAPFAHGYGGHQHPVVLECEGAGAACGVVEGALEGAGAELANGDPKGAMRVLVGPWARLRSDPVATLLESGPAEGGVYAEFKPAGGGWELVGLEEGGHPARTFGPDVGLVAATRRYEGPPVWFVTGTTAAGVGAAAGLLDEEDLSDHYAVATEAGKETTLPLRAP